MSESAAPTLKAARKPSASWINVRALLRGPQLRQSPQALKAAGRMVLVLPILQTLVLVGVLNSELWLALLGLMLLLFDWYWFRRKFPLQALPAPAAKVKRGVTAMRKRKAGV